MKRLTFLFALFLMGSSLPTLKYRALDNSGVPMSGAKLYFYEDGTTTPLATYSDEALTTANANPVVADSHGWFGEIYLKTTEAYKVVLKSALGITIWTVDDINASQLASNAFQTRIKQIASNPLDYGAVGDGVADESSYVQSAITNATGTVDLLGKTYRCDTTLTMKSGVTLKNGTLDFSHSASNSYITLTGTFATPILLDADAAVGDVLLSPVATTGFVEDDWIYVESNVAWADDTPTYGELYQIESISGGDFYLDRPIIGPYAFATPTRVYKLTPVSDVVLEDLTISAAPAAAGTGNVIVLSGAVNTQITNVNVDGPRGAAVFVSRAAHTAVSGLVVTGGSATSYGVRIRSAAFNTLVENSSFTSLALGVSVDIDAALDGLAVHTFLERNTFTRNTGNITVAQQAYGVVIADNTFFGGTTGILISAPTAQIERNALSYVTGYAIVLTTHTAADDTLDGYLIADNSIEQCGGGVDYSEPAAGTLTSLDFVNLRQNRYLGSNAAVYGLRITGQAANAHPIRSVEIAENTILGSFALGVRVYYVPSQVISNNVIDNINDDASGGITVYAPKTSAVIFENVISGGAAASTALYVGTDDTNAPLISVLGNTVSASKHGVGVGVAVDNTSVNVSSNTVSAPGEGIAVASTVYIMRDVAITGNRVSGATGAASVPITISGSAAGGLVTSNYVTRDDNLAGALVLDSNGAGASDFLIYFVVAGNTFYRGNPGISTDALDSIFSHNRFGLITTQITDTSSTGYVTDLSPWITKEMPVTVPSEGTGARATYTLTPTTSFVKITCADANGCDISLSETGAQTGQEVTIVFAGTNDNTFAESAGVLALSGADPFAMVAVGDALTLKYHSSQWNELSRTVETGHSTALKAFSVYEDGVNTGAGAWNEMVLNHTEYYDYGSWYDTSTGRATIPTAGVYTFSCSISSNDAEIGAASNYTIAIQTSGALMLAYAAMVPRADLDLYGNVSTTHYFSAGTVVSCYFYEDDADTITYGGIFEGALVH